MRFTDYIEKLGAKKMALQLGVSESQISNYRRLKMIPRPAVARQLIKQSKGRLDYKDIYEPYFKNLQNQKSKYRKDNPYGPERIKMAL